MSDRALPSDPVERLLMVAEGRRIYAESAPKDQRRLLLIEANAFRNAARVLTDDVSLELMIPTWSFEVPPIDELTSRINSARLES